MSKPRINFCVWFLISSTEMKKLLLHIFTVFALASMVAEDLFICMDFPEGVEMSGCTEEETDAKKENKTEDDTQGKSPKIKETDFYLSLTTIYAAHHVGIPECYSKFFHPGATLAIFVPPPNFA